FARWHNSGNGVLHIVTPGEPNEKALRSQNGSHRVAWTNDGKQIIHGRSLVPVDGSTVRDVRLPAGGRTSGEITVSRLQADGSTSLAFVEQTEDLNIWRKDLQPAGPARQIIASTRFDGFPRWSPDGNRIIFSSGRTGRPGMWLSDSEGGNLVELL